MTELKRWLDDSPPAAIASLLVAARREQAPSRVLERTLVAIGATAATSVAAASSSAATAAKVGTSVLGIIVKWGGAGLLGGAALVSGVAGVSRLRPSTARPAPSVLTTQRARVTANPSPDLPRAPVVAPSADVEAASAESVPTPVFSVAPRSVEPALAPEIKLVDAARDRLRNGDATAVVQLLAGYEARFSPAHFEPEVLYLRMQAALLRGDRAAASRVARLIVRHFPKSPEVGQAEEVLGHAVDAGDE